MKLHKLELPPILPLLLLSIIMVLSLLSCCGNIPVQVSDETLYVLEGNLGAVELHFLTSGETDITLDQWNEISEGMVCESASAWGDIKKEFSKFCSQVTCDYSTQKTISAFFERLAIAEARGQRGIQ